MQRLEYENGQLKGNTLANWEPMELPENWTDVVAPPCSGHQLCGGVLDSLRDPRDYRSFTDQEGRKAELAWSTDT